MRIKQYIDYPLVEGVRPRKYQMHRYFARKPANIVAFCTGEAYLGWKKKRRTD